MRNRAAILLFGFCLAISSLAAEFAPKPIPRMQVIPLPHNEFSFQRDGQELTRYHFSPDDKRPFLFPIIGPSGHILTRMGHPHDPFTHSHHNSMWVSHQFVNDVNFWEDKGRGQIQLVKIEEFTDGDASCSATVLNSWGETNKTFLFEHRRMTVTNLYENQWLLLLDMKFEANGAPVTLGKTAFGLAAVRMAKSIGVNDGGGMIRNSEGGVNEPGVHWKPARWVDYSGAVTSNVIEGITFFDHPKNPNHPTVFHVRNDGWMGASLTFTNAMIIETNKPLVLRYGFHMHRDLLPMEKMNADWTAFSKIPVPPFPEKKR